MRNSAAYAWFSRRIDSPLSRLPRSDTVRRSAVIAPRPRAVRRRWDGVGREVDTLAVLGIEEQQVAWGERHADLVADLKLLRQDTCPERPVRDGDRGVLIGCGDLDDGHAPGHR